MYGQKQEWWLSTTTLLHSDLTRIMHNIGFDFQQDRRLFHSANCPVQLWKLPISYLIGTRGSLTTARSLHRVNLATQVHFLHNLPLLPPMPSKARRMTISPFTSQLPWGQILYSKHSLSDKQALGLIYLLWIACLRSSLWTQTKGTVICSLFY
jgi:hypothetical protein